MCHWCVWVHFHPQTVRFLLISRTYVRRLRISHRWRTRHLLRTGEEEEEEDG